MSEWPENTRRPESTNRRKRTRTAIILVMAVAALGIVAYLYTNANRFKRSMAVYLPCPTHLCALGRAFLVYASENADKFPPPDKWCDLLLEDDRVTEDTFKCPYMKKGRCSYSMNPNADMATVSGKWVLLFETNAGWNSFGGPELLTAENHDGIGCNILFVDASVEFIRKDAFDKLLWGRKIDRQ